MAASDARDPREDESTQTPTADSAAATDSGAEAEAAGARYGVADPADAGRDGGRPTWVTALAIALPLVLLVGVLVVARQMIGDGRDLASEPLAAVGLPSPQGDAPECTALLDALPEELGAAQKVQLQDPAPAATAGYRLPDGEPITITCGVEAPPGFVQGTALQQVDQVQWFTEADPQDTASNTTYVAVDRPVMVALVLPADAGTGPIQDVSAVVADTLEQREPQPAPAG